jgi:Ala-tRNA(Pro) deacylase
MEVDEKVYAYLEDIKVSYKKHEHPPVYTVEEANEHWENITGMHCKNLFLRDKKGRRHYLVVLESSKQVDIKKMNAQLNERLSFASPERLMKHLGLRPGSVSPFGLINNVDNQVSLILDQDIKEAQEVNFHPNVNTATLTIASKDFMHYVREVGNPWQYLTI